MQPGSDRTRHAHTTRIDAPLDAVWRALTEPTNFPRLYPRRFDRVERVAPAFYVAVGPT